jgi:hypothetical protein
MLSWTGRGRIAAALVEGKVSGERLAFSGGSFNPFTLSAGRQQPATAYVDLIEILIIPGHCCYDCATAPLFLVTGVHHPLS